MRFVRESVMCGRSSSFCFFLFSQRPIRQVVNLARLRPEVRHRLLVDECGLEEAQYADVCSVLARFPILKVSVRPVVLDDQTLAEKVARLLVSIYTRGIYTRTDS